MRFTLTRFGGFGGISRPLASLDTREASEAQQTRLRQLLAQSNFWSLPAELPSDAAKPDSFSYELSVDDDGRQHSVSFTHASQSPELAALVSALKAASNA